MRKMAETFGWDYEFEGEADEAYPHGWIKIKMLREWLQRDTADWAMW